MPNTRFVCEAELCVQRSVTAAGENGSAETGLQKFVPVVWRYYPDAEGPTERSSRVRLERT
ncbi:hypothetical protein BD414DRAFT_480671 [Trametes punicea]|nr:hypothetical protein BD414DRAFT_480671 [Trametes punicea]